MKRVFIVFMIVAYCTLVGYAGTFQRVKTKLDTYITNQGLTIAQLKSFTEPQVTAWLANKYPHANNRVVWVALQQIIEEREATRVDNFMSGVMTTIRTQYLNAEYMFDGNVITITLEPE